MKFVGHLWGFFSFHVCSKVQYLGKRQMEKGTTKFYSVECFWETIVLCLKLYLEIIMQISRLNLGDLEASKWLNR